MEINAFINISTKITSVAIFYNDELYHTEVINVCDIKDNRIDKMIIGINYILDKYSPSSIYVEGHQKKGYSNNILNLVSEIMGSIRFWSLSNKCNYYEVPIYKIYDLKMNPTIRRNMIKKEINKLYNKDFDIKTACAIYMGNVVLTK